jgi:hypothetical protein
MFPVMLLISVCLTPFLIGFVLFPGLILEFFWNRGGVLQIPLESAPILALAILYAEVTLICGTCIICWYLAYKGLIVRRISRCF